MFCPNCGADLSDEADFCTQCGNNLEETNDQAQNPTAGDSANSNQQTNGEVVDFRLNEGEKLIKKGKANYSSSFFNKQGGKLYLTNQRLIFKAGNVNLGDSLMDIALDNVIAFDKAMNMFIIPNGLRIITKEEEEYKFTVWGRSSWVKEISRVING